MSDFEKKVKVAAYDPIVVDATPGQWVVGLSMSQDGQVVSVELFPGESKKLRKALKKAERVAKEKR